jgi:hypothetical protein
MGSSPGSRLGACRSQREALADLVAELNQTGVNNPRLPQLARMIQLLAEDIALRSRAETREPRRLVAGSAELGLC